MSGQLRSLKKRIKSIESTKKITRAMEMVSAAKLKRFQTLLAQAIPYTETLMGLINRVVKTDIGLEHPLLIEREEKEIALLLITSDSGLCGSYNADLIYEANQFIKTKERTPLLIGFGKHGVTALSRSGHEWAKTFVNIKAPDLEHSIKKTELLLEALFREKKIDAVYITHAQAINRGSYKAVTERLLPFRFKKSIEENGEELDYIFEPDAHFLFTKLIPLAFELKLREMFFESFVTEQTSRMHAMHQATENATGLVDTLVILRNKIRQAAITRELIEIVSGSNALKR